MLCKQDSSKVPAEGLAKHLFQDSSKGPTEGLAKHLRNDLVKHLSLVYLKVEIPAINPIQAIFVTKILITAHPNCCCWNS